MLSLSMSERSRVFRLISFRGDDFFGRSEWRLIEAAAVAIECLVFGAAMGVA